jgi:uncharacterized protein
MLVVAADFVNRQRETAALDAFAKGGGVAVIFGRRRVGKTRLVARWLEKHRGRYTQAIEGPAPMQLAQVAEDLAASGLELAAAPKSWNELFRLLTVANDRRPLCIDEFPYLVESAPELPSLLQRWIDHSMPKGSSLVLAGSSRRMMHSVFLDEGAPLYGRARLTLHVEPMSYRDFCEATGLSASARASFAKFALVGGIPRYWELLDPTRAPATCADELYFGFAPPLEREPDRILQDDGAAGAQSKAILEAIGRGAERVSEIGARMGTPVANLGRPVQLLVDLSLITRDLPYGESLRTTKRTLYRIVDPSTRFWYRVYSPHRARWRDYDEKTRTALVEQHAATVLEDELRRLYPDGARYWERDLEIDLVRPLPNDRKQLIATEVKWSLPKRERARVLSALEARVAKSSLAGRVTTFEVLDAEDVLTKLG